MGIAADEARQTTYSSPAVAGRAAMCCCSTGSASIASWSRRVRRQQIIQSPRLRSGPWNLPAVGIETAIARGLQENSDMFVFLAASRTRSTAHGPVNVGHTPAWKSLVAQDAVEEEILRVVERSKRTVLFSTECDHSGVHQRRLCRTRSEATGEITEWSATYLIAAGRQPNPPQRRHRDGQPATLAVMSNEYGGSICQPADCARGGGFVIPTSSACARGHPQHQRP